MKKILTIALILTLSVCLLAACGKKDTGDTPTPANNGSGSTEDAGKKLTPSITAPEGWERLSTASLSYSYEDEDEKVSSLSVVAQSDPLAEGATVKDFAESIYNHAKETQAGNEFTDIIEFKLNGMDAAEFTVKAESSTVRYIYVTKNTQVFFIQCTSQNLTGEVSAAFQSMVDSFALN